MGRGWTFGQKVALGFGVSVSMLVVIGVVAYRTTDVLVENNRMVTHTQAVLEALSTLLSSLTDAETGGRGFVLTGNESFLEPHHAALEAIPRDLADVRTLTSDNPNQQRRLDAAGPIIQARLAHLKRAIDLRRDEGFDAALKVVASGEGKAIMDELRKVISAMDLEERQLLKQRNDAAEAGATGA